MDTTNNTFVSSPRLEYSSVGDLRITDETVTVLNTVRNVLGVIDRHSIAAYKAVKVSDKGHLTIMLRNGGICKIEMALNMGAARTWQRLTESDILMPEPYDLGEMISPLPTDGSNA